MRWFGLIETIRAALGMSSNDGRKEGEVLEEKAGYFYFPFSICHFPFVISVLS